MTEQRFDSWLREAEFDGISLAVSMDEILKAAEWAWRDDEESRKAAPRRSQSVARGRPATAGNRLTSRAASCLRLLRGLQSGKVSLATIPTEIAERLRTHPAPSVRGLAATVLGKPGVGPASLARV